MKKQDTPFAEEIFDAAFDVSDSRLPGTRPDLAAETEALAEQFAPLLRSFPEAEPDPGLFAAIEAEIDGIETAPSSDMRAGGGEWVQRTDKVWKKLLAEDPASGRSTYLLRCLPGATIKPHLHERAEHIFVIEGELWVGGKLFSAGDAQISLANSVHAEITMPAGCLVLVSV